MAQIILYKIPEMDMTYENAPYFDNRTAQHNWINGHGHQKAILDGKISVDPNRTSVTIAKSYAEIEQMDVDYCALGDPSGKWLYYFVADYDYKTNGATTLILELDVLQTYMFDFTWKDTFVDRCHVNRWEKAGMSSDLIPTMNYLEEGLQYGDYYLAEDRKSIKKFEDKFLISSTTPLGRNDWNRPVPGGQGGGGEFPSGNCWQQGYMSALGFRFVKGYEAFAPHPYKDDLGYWTIAYGVTQHGEPGIYNKLMGMVPVPEIEGAKITYELKKKNYGDKILPTCKELGITKQYQFDALMSFSFNLGYGVITDRNSKIYKAIKADINNEAAIREAFVAYRNPGTIVEEGLRQRRNEECDMFFGRYPKARPIQIWGSNNKPTGKYVTDNNGNGWLPSGCGDDTPSDMKTYKAYNRNFVYPLQGGKSRITSKLGWRIHPITGQQKYHNGDDIGCPLNQPIYAAHSGTVTLARDDGKVGYGRWIILQSDDAQVQTYYAHCNSLLVSVGDKVKAGQEIAKAGTTGSSTGVHLHYELRLRQSDNTYKVVDPLPHMKTGAIL